MSEARSHSTILRPTTIAALAAYDAGLNSVPPKEDGTKRPDDPHWKSRPRLPRSLVETMYETGAYAGATGLGILTGAVYRAGSLDEPAEVGIECLDFDDPDAFDAYAEKAEADPELAPLFAAVRNGYEEETPTGGVHIFHFCEHVEGNQKLAERPKTEAEKRHKDDRTKTRIETRGIGGYVVTAPSNGRVHRSGKPYRILRGGFATIATVTPDQRAKLLDLARTFDQMPKTEARERPAAGERSGPAGSGRPGDDYNAAVGWDDVLTPHGWSVHSTDGHVTYWRRPGAQTRNRDAATNKDGTDRLWVFSTSTVFPTVKYLNKFAAYAYLNHGGDFAAAAKDLHAKGYTGEATAEETTVGRGTPGGKSEQPFRIYTVAEYRQRPIPPSQIKGIVRKGSFFEIVGGFGSFKTFVGIGMGLSVSLGKPWVGFETAQGPVLYIVGEGGGLFMRRIDAWKKYYGIADDPPDFLLLPEAVQMLRDGDLDRLMEAVATLPKPPELVFIDTLARTAVGGNENSQEDMTNYVGAVDRIRGEIGATVGLLHHNNRQGEYRGSSVIPGALDTIIATEATADGVTLRCDKQKDDEPFPDIRLQKIRVTLDDGPPLNEGETDPDRPTSLVFVRVGTEPDAEDEGIDLLKPNERKALRALADSVTEWVMHGQWVALSGVAAGSLHRLIPPMKKVGYIDVDDRGKGKVTYYRITDHGRAVLDGRENPFSSGGGGEQ